MQWSDTEEQAPAGPDLHDPDVAKKIIDTHLRDSWGNCAGCRDRAPVRYPCDLAVDAAIMLGAAPHPVLSGCPADHADG